MLHQHKEHNTGHMDLAAHVSRSRRAWLGAGVMLLAIAAFFDPRAQRSPCRQLVYLSHPAALPPDASVRVWRWKGASRSMKSQRRSKGYSTGLLALALGLLSLPLLAQSWQVPRLSPGLMPNPVAGKSLYESNCASCHGGISRALPAARHSCIGSTSLPIMAMRHFNWR